MLFLFYLSIFRYQISWQADIDIDNDNSKIIYKKIKKIYKLLHIISLISLKSYLDKVINLEDLELILKMLVLFSINNHKNLDIKEKSNIENIMYLKECIGIIRIIYKDKSSKEEQNLLINILKYINDNICLSDNNNNEKIVLNYTNRFYLINNDHNTTQLLKLMLIIYKINNPDINNAYFDLISNIYCFQFKYNNFFWPLYSYLEPLLVNIDKKSYSEISKEISFPKFQLNLINYLTEKEKIIIKEHPLILKNGFYFGEKSNNGIISEIGTIPPNCIITFGFKLIINKNEPKRQEYILVQFKSKKENKPALLKISICNRSDRYYFSLFTQNKTEYDRTEIVPNKYYIFSLHFKNFKWNIRYYCDELPQQIFFELHKTINFPPKDEALILCVGCDLVINNNKIKDESNSYMFNSFKNQFTGFIGDFHIINSEGFELINDDLGGIISKKEDKGKEIDLQDIIVNLKGRYGNAVIKSIYEQYGLDEYITTNIDEIQKLEIRINDPTYFKSYINKERIKYRIIDNVFLYISAYNFKLIDYMDNIDYLNYDNLYYEKGKELRCIKKEYQYVNNFRSKREDIKHKILVINTKLFNCNFNVFENRSTFLKFYEEDGIFYLILILEYYYQILYKINHNINNDNDENNIIKKEEILNLIEKNIYDILIFFKKAMQFNIKNYKITLFYYQINVVIKEYILIRNINEKTLSLLLDFLNTHHIKSKEEINN